jgi:O-antigen ligase
MSGLLTIYRLTVLAFFVATTFQPVLRSWLLQAKWGFLGLLLLASLGTASSRPTRVWDASYLLLVAFLAAGLLSFLDGVVGQNAMFQLGSVALALLASAAFALRFASEESRLRLLKVHGTVAWWVAWTSLPLLLLGVNLGRAVGRFSGWTDNPNSLGVMMSLLWPAVLQGALQRPGWSIASPRLLAVAMAILLLATGSRASVLAATLATLVLLASTGRMRARMFTAAMVLGLLGFIFSGPLTQAMSVTPGLNRLVDEDVVEYLEGGEGAEFKASGREVAWDLALRLIADRPWGGYGWGAEAVLLPQFKQELLQHDGANVHNSYLSLLLQVGWLGATPVLLCFAVALLRGYRRVLWLRSRASLHHAATPVLLALVAGALVHAVFESTLFYVGNLTTPVFWPALFLLLRSDVPLRDVDPPRPPAEARRAPPRPAAPMAGPLES